MSKELFISSSPHETKVAVLEDDQLVEVYYERDIDAGLAGGIYKGRVSRVLPGMQSAFVDIGLERDAFLYVSDFYEDEVEYEKVFSEAEARATKFAGESQAGAAEPSVSVAEGEKGPAASAPAAPFPETAAISTAHPDTGAAPPAPQVAPTPPAAGGAFSPSEFRRHDARGPRRRGRGFGEHRFPSKPQSRERSAERQGYGAPHTFEILPGESLAKYGRATPETPPLETAAGKPSETPVAKPAAGVSPAEGSELPRSETSAEVDAKEPAAAAVAPLVEPLPAVESVPTIPTAAGSEPRGDEQATGAEPFGESAAGLGGEAPPDPDRADIAEVEALPIVEALAPGGEPEGSVERPATAEPLEAPPPPEPVAAPAPEFSPPGPAPEGPQQSAVEVVAVIPPTLEGGPAEAPTSAGPAEESPEAPPARQAAPLEVPAEPTEHKYTLREPHQRPRFAPRRRRGRRGLGQRAARLERQEPSRPGNHQPVQIGDLLKEGQEILVQIAKEPLGTKGARITSHIALPGRYLVYMPTISHIGVSRKIASEEERLRLRNIILENRGSLTGGFIVRTAGEGRSEEEFRADLRFLSTSWSEIRAKAEGAKAPALIHRDVELVQRILRDILSPDFKLVRVDSETDYERVVEFVNRCQPSLVGHVRLYTRPTPMFEEFGIQAEIDKALKPKVWLKSGGYIVINQTEALVAIDVNTGKYVGKTSRLEDTIVKTNIDAVNEIVRQIRLRDLGGIIVIDFIDMDERKNRLKVVQALEEALRHDRAPTKILSFNDFGLVAITRKRVKHSLERTLCQPCPYCTGSGWVKSVTSVCYEVLAEAKKMASQIEGDSITLRVNPEVAHALKSRQGALIAELESSMRRDVIIKSDPTMHQERFEIY